MSNDEPIDLIGVLSGLKFHLIPGILAALATFGLLQMTTDTSTSSVSGAPATAEALIYVSQPKRMPTSEELSTYAVVGSSTPVMVKIGSQMEPAMTLEATRRAVSVWQYNGSLTLLVRVNAPSVAKARHLASVARDTVIAEVPGLLPADSAIPKPELKALGDVRDADSTASSGSRAAVKGLVTRAGAALAVGALVTLLSRLLVTRLRKRPALGR